jgi:hypothetical protein
LQVLEYVRIESARPVVTVFIATVLGAVVGALIAGPLFEPMLRLLSKGRHVYVFNVDDSFHPWLKFAIGCGLGGSVTFATAAFVAPSLRSFAVWLLVLAVAFGASSAIGVIIARERLGPVFMGAVPLSSAPVLAGPLAGTVGVVILAIVVKLAQTLILGRAV